MNMQITHTAKQHLIDVSGLSRKMIIRKLQRQEGSFDCFATASDGKCDLPGCMWREDCFKAAKA